MDASDFRSSLPLKPTEGPGPPSRKPTGSLLPIMLASIAGLTLLGVLTMMSFGFAALVACVALFVMGTIAFHYLVWGWWLGALIRREMEAEEAEDA